MKGPWRTVITPQGWKLNLSPTDQCELYDLNSDPGERKNVINQHPEIAASMKQQLANIIEAGRRHRVIIMPSDFIPVGRDEIERRRLSE